MALVSFLPLLVALSGSGRALASQPLAPPFPVACALVSRADVAQALGRSVGPGKPEFDSGLSTCDYAAGSGIVTITVERVPGRLDVPYEIATLAQAIPDGRLRQAHLAATGPGTPAGTTAFYLDLDRAGTQLHVIRGEHDYVMVSILGFGDAGRVSQAAEKIARKALEGF